MIKKNPIARIITVMLLAFVILLPTIIKVSHHHTEQKLCKDYSQKNFHVDHENADFCDICFFSISSFNHLFYKTDNFTSFICNTEPVKTDYSFKLSSSAFTSKQLRAPPLFTS